MNPRLKKRLDAVENRLMPDPNLSGTFFIQEVGESDEEVRERIARWRAGEKVEGQDRPYTGQMVGVIKLVEAKNPFLD